ncbi:MULTISPECIES: glycoside hydrolase family 2 TIM barrel-domain containing protein [Sphingobacterium]|uniref:glycoside hydrolase family 2 TIM barrel-domain containing protein n=1 Tax=Sphingobacterium TaxID=28453 RepID=UPI00129C52E8|nr:MULTISPECIES: glycoside hydrolase family 2 TIM barrel-domain containing protein [Sphingobacterium]MCS4163756.1 beta-galactosidase [Sphingobacterium sp. BIGb0116]
MMRLLRTTYFLFLLFLLVPGNSHGQSTRQSFLLEKNWRFFQGEVVHGESVALDDNTWKNVTVPHDWAIFGPFDRSHDLQDVAVTQNGEKKATVKTGRTGGLPYVGVGWYRTKFDIPQFNPVNKRVVLKFDGAMSEARVYVNGKEACFWPYGYNAFHCDVTEFLHQDGMNNTVAVRLENKAQSSRWYPGAGLYRNVHVIVTEKIHVPVWGTYITTPFVSDSLASVKLETSLKNADGKLVRMVTAILDATGQVVAQKENQQKLNYGKPFVQNLEVINPALWSPEHPNLYRASTQVFVEGKLTDSFETRFGIREVRIIADRGFMLNGKVRKFQGVCNHHDLGPLGAAINVSALRYQLELLKDMGCDAIRTAHNMPAPELVALCDELGFMLMIEPFDEWDIAKCKNGYHRFFADWAERDMVNMIRHFRNNPSVVMWSIGNEVPTQCSAEGYKVASFLQDICHREDPSRPVTCGMDQVSCVLENGFASLLDVPGLNYRAHRYEEAYAKLPQNLVLGSETASTVSSRGVYKFPVLKKGDMLYSDHQSSSYDMEYCSWSNLPDEDFALAEDHHWTMGQFVWTGFDYLGEPSPYDTDAWPNHSSMFGIIDLASIPKDRYYLYRSLWNRNEHTLHILPHWTWPERVGQETPVFVYTDYPSAELFINGKSQGIQRKSKASLQERYRLMWMNTIYEPGEVKVVAYDESGKPAAEKIIRTAGKPSRIEMDAVHDSISADGRALAYIRVKAVDKAGNLCPRAAELIQFDVVGDGTFKALANGDPTNLEAFHKPQMHLFNGQLTLIVQAGEKSGKIQIKAKCKGLKEGVLTVQTVNSKTF